MFSTTGFPPEFILSRLELFKLRINSFIFNESLDQEQIINEQFKCLAEDMTYLDYLIDDIIDDLDRL